MADVEVLYRESPPFGKVDLGLLLETDRLLRCRRFQAAFLRRTKYSFLVRLRHRRTPMVLDIHSGSIEEGRLRRMIENGLLRANVAFSANITVISAGLAGQLSLPHRWHVLPLGADRRPVAVGPCRDEQRVAAEAETESPVRLALGVVGHPDLGVLIDLVEEGENAGVGEPIVAIELDDDRLAVNLADAVEGVPGAAAAP